MNAGREFSIAVLAPSAAADVYNPGTTTGGVNDPNLNLYVVLKHIRVVNQTAGPVAISLWVGATGATADGTEFAWEGTSVPADSYLDWYGTKRLDVADFLVALAGAASSLILNLEGYYGIA